MGSCSLGVGKIENILLIKLRHLGDVLLISPAISALKNSFPSAKITALVNSGTEAVLSGHPHLDDIITFDRKIKSLPGLKKYFKELQLLKTLRNRRFDLAIDFTGGDRAAIASYFSGAKVRVGKYNKKKGLWNKHKLYTNCIALNNDHVVYQNMTLIRHLVKGGDNFPVIIGGPVRIYGLDDANKVTASFGIKKEDKLIHIHPTSRWFFKCWPDEHMAFCMNVLIQKGYKLIVTSAPDKKETDRVDNILSILKTMAGFKNDMVAPLHGSTGVKELAVISQKSELFFGVDSAPMHIAASVNTPVVALFGPSGAFNWGPWDNNKTPCKTQYPLRNGMQKSGVHTVIQRNWDCVPCGQDGCNGSKKSKCLDDISPDEVINVILEKLKQ